MSRTNEEIAPGSTWGSEHTTFMEIGRNSASEITRSTARTLVSGMCQSPTVVSIKVLFHHLTPGTRERVASPDNHTAGDVRTGPESRTSQPKQSAIDPVNICHRPSSPARLSPNQLIEYLKGYHFSTSSRIIHVAFSSLYPIKSPEGPEMPPQTMSIWR